VAEATALALALPPLVVPPRLHGASSSPLPSPKVCETSAEAEDEDFEVTLQEFAKLAISLGRMRRAAESPTWHHGQTGVVAQSAVPECEAGMLDTEDLLDKGVVVVSEGHLPADKLQIVQKTFQLHRPHLYEEDDLPRRVRPREPDRSTNPSPTVWFLDPTKEEVQLDPPVGPGARALKRELKAFLKRNPYVKPDLPAEEVEAARRGMNDFSSVRDSASAQQWQRKDKLRNVEEVFDLLEAQARGEVTIVTVRRLLRVSGLPRVLRRWAWMHSVMVLPPIERCYPPSAALEVRQRMQTFLCSMISEGTMMEWFAQCDSPPNSGRSGGSM